MSAGLHTVHVRVNDAATGQPTPVRIRFTDPDGRYYAPFGRLAEFATGPNQDVGGSLLLDGKAFAYIDGTCEIALPAGPLQVEIHKGPEYLPLHRDIVLSPGKLALRFAIEGWSNLRAEGWYSGDMRAHGMTPHAALLEGMAEDLAVVNLLATELAGERSNRQSYPAIPNILAFSGQQPALEKPGCMVVVNTHNTHAVLGSLGLLNCHRPVYPLRFGAPGGCDDWALADWCDQCRRKRGLVVGIASQPGQPEFPLGETLADLILGKVDAFEVAPYGDASWNPLAAWYTLLNAGIPVPLVGASGKDRNSVLLGGVRTCARLLPGEELSYRNWIEAVRAGRTFVTTGPILSFCVNGLEPGATLTLPSEVETVTVWAEARSGVPFDRLEVVANGAVVTAAEANGPPWSAVLETPLPVTGVGWLAARCRVEGCTGCQLSPEGIISHTSAVTLRRLERPACADPAPVASLTGQLDRALAWVQHAGRFTSERRRDFLAGIFAEARGILSKEGSR